VPQNKTGLMKKRLIRGVIILVVGLCAPQIAMSQGSVTFLSNLEQTSTGSAAVGSDSWLAATFFTGGNAGGYLLNSVQLSMSDGSGSPSDFTVMIYSANIGVGINPGSSVGTLTGSANPATGGNYTYSTPSLLTLSSGTPYFIVITSGTAVANGAYDWSLSGIDSYNPAGGWGVINGVSSGVYQSGNGTSWTSLSATYPQFAIDATAAPEPGVIGLFALGGLLIAFQRRKAGPI
jgi:hypothetical protein